MKGIKMVADDNGHDDGDDDDGDAGDEDDDDDDYDDDDYDDDDDDDAYGHDADTYDGTVFMLFHVITSHGVHINCTRATCLWKMHVLLIR